ncbi:MAG: hypothetical protein P1V97_31905, partial [Planctomycetota bacterium]|nr:hypothetical protein [Planctomycetota bacterium]
MALKKIAVVTFLCLSGCQLGTFSKFDGTGPIPLDEPHMGWGEQGGGEHGTIVKQIGKENRFAQVTFSNERDFQFDKPLAASLSTPSGLIRSTSEQVYKHSFGLTGISRGALIAESKDIKEIDYQQTTLALRTPNGIYLKSPKRALEHFYKGPSLALSLDMPRDGLWIVKNVPCAVLEYWDLSKKTIRLRIPLPVELESANITIVRAENHIAVYAYDRPLANALFIDVAHRRITSLSGIVNKRPLNSTLTHSNPPLLVPHSQKLGERISMPSQRKRLGRIVRFNKNQFIVFTRNLRRSNGRFSLPPRSGQS